MVNDTKKCKTCEVEKPLEDFYPINRNGKTYRSPYCKNPCWKTRNATSYARYQAQRQADMRGYRLRLKKQVIAGYGGACTCCGETEILFLTVEHLNSDGKAHRELLGVSGGPVLHRDIIARGFPDDLTVLCFNCNTGKYLNGGVCPHNVTPGRVGG